MATAALPNDDTAVTDALSSTARDRASQRAIQGAARDLREQLDQGLVLAGRRFVPLRTVTFDLQNRRVDVVRRAGVLAMCAGFDIVTGDAEVLAAEVLQAAFASGALYDMLAHLLVEDGVEYLPWSPDAAKARAQFFATLVEPSDHQTLSANMLWLVLDFFLNASASSEIFLKSLAAPAIALRRDELRNKDNSAPTNRPPSTRDTAADSPSAATTTSDDGTQSSEPLRDSAPSTS